jgi:hypothetical protein
MQLTVPGLWARHYLQVEIRFASNRGALQSTLHSVCTTGATASSLNYITSALSVPEAEFSFPFFCTYVAWSRWTQQMFLPVWRQSGVHVLLFLPTEHAAKAKFNNSIYIWRLILLFVYLSKNTYFICLSPSSITISILPPISIKYYFFISNHQPRSAFSLFLTHIELDILERENSYLVITSHDI